MKNQVNGISSSFLATLMLSVPAQEPTRDSRKAKPITIEAYLLPQHMHHNRAEIQEGELCGCISCEQRFLATEIRSWVAAGNTAICPRCGETAVVGSGAGFQLTSQLLHRAHLLLLEGMGRLA
jgi:hypothetical protein